MPPTSRRLLTVDVFTATPLAGNPVAVVLDAAGLDDAAMQRIAAWTNLSETTFVLPPTQPGADYQLRIFTPRSELRFAGHPTLGSAHAVLEAGLATAAQGTLRQECRAGVLPLRVETDAAGRRRVHVQAPPAAVTPMSDADAATLAAALGATPDAPRRIDVGPVWLVARLRDEAAVRGLEPDLAAVAALSRATGASGGVTVFAEGAPLVVRSFAPAAGVPEDPVCGSGNAAVGAWRVAEGTAGPSSAWSASQGRELGRDGVVDVAVAADGAVWIGGHTVTVVEGVLRV